jgi:hypothetical protein
MPPCEQPVIRTTGFDILFLYLERERIKRVRIKEKWDLF